MDWLGENEIKIRVRYIDEDGNALEEQSFSKKINYNDSNDESNIIWLKSSGYNDVVISKADLDSPKIPAKIEVIPVWDASFFGVNVAVDYVYIDVSYTF